MQADEAARRAMNAPYELPMPACDIAEASPRNGSPIRLLIADDHTMFREAMTRLLMAQPDFQVIAEASSSSEVVEGLRNHTIDVAIVDLSMPGRDGFDLIRYVKELWPVLPVLVLTMHTHMEYARRALKAGASGFLTKEDPLQDLLTATRRLAAGGRYLSPDVAQKLAFDVGERTPPEQPYACLTQREFKVFEMLLHGKSGMEIARTLSLSKQTVSTHKINLYRKLNVRNQSELIHYAIEHGLADR